MCILKVIGTYIHISDKVQFCHKVAAVHRLQLESSLLSEAMAKSEKLWLSQKVL